MDEILYWNEVALEANRVSHSNGKNEQTGPTLSSRALAIVHLAMYDAYAAALDTPATLPRYLAAPASEPGASAPAAVAAAACATLSALFPSQSQFFQLKHLQAGLQGSGLDSGQRLGLAVAQAILADRACDPGASDAGYCASPRRGAHRPDPDNPKQGFHGPFYGSAKLFGTSAAHALDAPPALGSQEYARALRQVRAKGIAPELMGTLPNNLQAQRRNVDETLIGIYWGYDGARELGTPPRLYNQIIRQVAVAQNNDTAANARLFAFVNAAMGDAGILAWKEKYRHDFWRPVVGIREHDGSMGPTAVGGNNIDNDTDTGWLPLGAPSTNAQRERFAPPTHTYPCQHELTAAAKNFTPPFPAYPSGHATFGAAAFHMTRLFYGVPAGNKSSDTLFNGLVFVSDEFNGVSADNEGTIRPRHVRSFPRGLWQMIEENGFSRVYLGVHWVFDAFAVTNQGAPDFSANVGGVPLGLDIAEDMFQFGGGKAPKKP